MERFGSACALGVPYRARHDAARWPLAVALGATLLLGSADACAAALDSIATSAGLLAALAALFIIKSWPAHLTAAGLSTASGALVLAGGATWLWRRQALVRLAGFAGRPRFSGMALDPAAGGLPTSASVALPAEIDRERLLVALRRHFVMLQQAWDRHDMVALRQLATSEMVEELCLELAGCNAPGEDDCTEVVTVRAELLGFEALAHVFVLSVEFSGLIRESPDAGAVAFRELWMLTQSKQQSEGWRLARHQALL